MLRGHRWSRVLCFVLATLLLSASGAAARRTVVRASRSSRSSKPAPPVAALPRTMDQLSAVLKSQQDVHFSEVEMQLPGEAEDHAFRIPDFMVSLLKKFELLSERQHVHHFSHAKVEEGETIHPQWRGADAVVAEHLILDEERRQTRAQHASTIVQVGNGDLLSAWFGGQWEKGGDVGIWMSRFKDGAWSRDAWQVVPPVNAVPCWNPVLFHLPATGETLLFYKVGMNTETWRPFILRSHDNGLTWGSPEPFPRDMEGPAKNKPLLLADGTLIAGASEETQGWTVHVEYSKDGGRTWNRTPDIKYTKPHIIQPALFQTPNGVKMLIRSKDGVIVRASSEDGLHWSPATPTDVPNPNSGLDTVTLRDGRVLLVYNPLNDNGRYVLAVAVSFNDGRKFVPMVVLENFVGGKELPKECQEPDSKSNVLKRPEYSYPAIIQAADGLVHITYTYSYNGAMRKCSGRENIKHVILDPARLPSDLDV
mmetsp:Transcript_33585/g.85810  ORF Transcript_33585/g.85810 Transcript_33585/m.85810 type:complete len:480 (-) Transcript_33585:127-1566(-)|eukprot:jgi/Tetstr1/438171/TSEL_026773.t1